MDDKFKKIIHYLLMSICGLGIIIGFIFIFIKNDTLNKIGTILSTLSSAFEVSLIFKFRFDVYIKTIRNEYKIKIEQEAKQIISLSNRLNVKNYQIENMNANFNKPIEVLKNPDDSLYEKMKELYDPIEEFFVLNGGFGAPFVNKPFMDLMIFSEDCELNRYKFIDPSLRDIHEKLKISTCRLADLMLSYSHNLESNSGVSKFLYLDIVKKESYMPGFYSKAVIDENKNAFNRANELLKEIFDNYRKLDDTYKALRFMQK